MVIHQTEADLKEEALVVDFFSRRWGVTMYQVDGDLSPFDRVSLRDNSIVGFVEAKRRYVGKNTYHTIYLSVRKAMDLMTAKNSAEMLGFQNVGAVFAVSTDDAYGYYMLGENTSVFHVKIVGRTDRGLKNDTEPCFLIPVCMFKWYTKGGEEIHA